MNPGHIVSRYRIVGRIGQGGMGVVYRADDTRLDRQVALKFLPREGFSEQSRNRFLNEARAAAKARHPNICPIHDIEEADGELFLVMAYIEGETLQRRIAWRTLEPAQVIEFAAQIASGLACAHTLGIVHRDIKSGNIMVDLHGHASILDFGLALAPDALRLTNAGASVGTPAYMSPEQIKGREVDARTDLWSLGVVMFEMLTGVLPFRREQSAAIIHAVLHDPLPSISSLRPGVPPELQRVIEKALSKDVNKRWRSASEMATELQRLGGGTGISLSRDNATQTMAIPITQHVLRGSWRVAAIVAGVLVVAVGGVALYQYRSATVPAVPAGPTISASPAAGPTGGLKAVAILPFHAEPGAQSIADGLGEILAVTLSDVERTQDGLPIVAASELRARHIGTVDDARRTYGATAAITGAARIAAGQADKIEFTMNLVDTLSGKPTATRTFIYDSKDPLVSKDRAISAVLAMMNLDSLAYFRAQAVSSNNAPAPSAYSAYLNGRGFLARYDLPGNVDRAVVSFQNAIQQDPKYALAYTGLGEAYWRKAKATGEQQWATLANQNAERAVQLDGGLAIAHTVLGYVYLDAGRQPDAIRELQRAMDLGPSNAEAPRKLAEIYKALGRFDQAEALYLRSTKSRPTDWYGYLLLGVFYYERERYTDAEAALNQAKSLTPDNNLVRLDLGGIYRMHGRYREAVEEYQNALRIRTDADTYAGLGGAYFYQHKFPEAVSAVEAAIDLDSSDYRYWGNLGTYSRWAPGSESKSAPALRRAIELATKFVETTKSDYSLHANLAEYRARLGDAKAALAEIEQIPVTARGPLATRLAIVYELTGHRDKAIAVVRDNLKSAASLNQVKDHPDLAAVWREGKFQ